MSLALVATFSGIQSSCTVTSLMLISNFWTGSHLPQSRSSLRSCSPRTTWAMGSLTFWQCAAVRTYLLKKTWWKVSTYILQSALKWIDKDLPVDESASTFEFDVIAATSFINVSQKSHKWKFALFGFFTSYYLSFINGCATTIFFRRKISSKSCRIIVIIVLFFKWGIWFSCKRFLAWRKRTKQT